MGETLPARQKWLETALQGLAFWIGHRHSLFRHYPLAEGALVAEACNLIQANIPHELVLFPECMYKNLLVDGAAIPEVGAQARADLVLCTKAALETGRNGNVAAHTRFVLEVKRADASKQLIDSDLIRLHNYLAQATPGTRCFLIVVSERKSPKRFVKEGKSILGEHKIAATDGHYRVRRSVKAAASFSGKSSAHYVCLIEVFLKGQSAQNI